MKKLLVIAAMAACVLSCKCNSSKKATAETAQAVTKSPIELTAEGQMFTDFEIDGVKFSDFIGKGKYVLVDFWASWCGPCRGEMPNLRAVYNDFHGDKFDMLSVAVWDKPEDTLKAAEEEGIVWNQIINAKQVPTDIYGIEGIPHIILFGPDGTILKRNLRGEKIREAVAEALAE